MHARICTVFLGLVAFGCGGDTDPVDSGTTATGSTTATGTTATGTTTTATGTTTTATGTTGTTSKPLFSLDEPFTRADPASDSPSGHNVVNDCSATGETWDPASANIVVDQYADSTTISISLMDAKPDTLFTTWLRLKGTDPVTGESYGGSPLTGAGSTALAPSTEIATLDAIMNSVGEPDAYNAFWTDAYGNGQLVVELDFGLIGGEYPFQNYDPKLYPVPIVGAPNAPFMIRLASHCTDGLAHGLVQGDRETWFNWSPL